jgi:hypothetical protein
MYVEQLKNQSATRSALRNVVERVGENDACRTHRQRKHRQSIVVYIQIIIVVVVDVVVVVVVVDDDVFFKFVQLKGCCIGETIGDGDQRRQTQSGEQQQNGVDCTNTKRSTQTI